MKSRWFIVFIIGCTSGILSVKTCKEAKEPSFGSVLFVKQPTHYKIINRTLVQISQEYHGCQDHEIEYKFNGSHFIIGPVLSSYSGTFDMMLKNVSGSWKNVSFCIKVKHKAPQVEYRKIIVDEDDTVNMTCTYETNCNLKPVWYKKVNYNPLKSWIHNFNRYNGKIVYTMEASRNSNGKTYTCELLCTGQKTKLKLEVKVPREPTMDLTETAVFYVENEDAKLIGRIFGSPPPELTCTHGNSGREVIFCAKESIKKILYDVKHKPCESANRRYRLSSRENQTSKITFLIRQIQFEKDNGTIICRLVNKKDVSKFTFAVNVRVLPEVNVSRNGNVIDCIVRANPPPEIKWKVCESNRTNCQFVKPDGAIEYIGNAKYKSRIFINKSSANMVECKAGTSKGIYVFPLKTGLTTKVKTEGGGDKTIFIGLGSGLFFISIFVGVLVFLMKRRKGYNKYQQYVKADNNNVIDPLKTLNEQMYDLSYDEDWEFPYKNLELGEILGCGAFGKVYKAQAYGIGMLNSREKSAHAEKQRRKLNKSSAKLKHALMNKKDCSVVAVKTTNDNPSVDDIRNLAGELKMIIHVGQHENIVNVLGACTRYPRLYMILEYCSHGSLLEFLHKKRNIFEPTWIKEDFTSEERFTFANLMIAATQVSNGMKFLASKKCVHRDLAARNVLVAENYVMKVADFGLARDVFQNSEYISSTKGVLPVKWMALESIIQKVYNEKSDV